MEAEIDGEQEIRLGSLALLIVQHLHIPADGKEFVIGPDDLAGLYILLNISPESFTGSHYIHSLHP